MKLNFHQATALYWLITAPFIFAPVLQSSKRPDAGSLLAWGVTTVAVMILVMPLLTRWPTFRSWYGWTDAMSERQRKALAQRNLRSYYQNAFEDGYVLRLKPYLWRIMWTFAAWMLFTAALPMLTEHSAIHAVVYFSFWYPLAVLVVALASCPIARDIAERRKHRL